MKRVLLKRIVTVALGLALSVFFIPPLSADQSLLEASDIIDMVAGDIQTIDVNNLTRVSVTNPEIADISDAQGSKVSLLAKRPGETVLFLWDTGGKRSIKVRVVKEDLGGVKAKVQSILREAGITGLTLDENFDIGKVVISGSLPKDDKNRFEAMLQPYEENLLELVKEGKSEDLVQVDMQIVEISTSYEKDLGILWNSGGASGSTGTSTGTTGSTSGLISESETLPSTNGNGKIGDFFKIGNFARTSVQATINAFIQEGKARLISKPRLVAMSGKQASFLVGGEIPIETTTTNTTGSTLTQNTSYTQYGVNVTVTPTVREGKIDVVLNVDIRDIDASNSSGGNVAFITRTASTNVFMDNRQTIALAGLIKYADNEQVTKVPFLSNIPIVGALFRNRNTPSPDTNTEMVIVLTPTLLTDKKFANSQVVMPTASERQSEKEVTGKYEQEPIPSSLAPIDVTMPQQADNNQQMPSQQPVVAQAPVQEAPPVVPPMTIYARMVQERISKAIFYPQVSMGMPLQGTVKLKLHIRRDGTLDSEVVMESSGNDVLDQDAMQAAKTAAPFDAFRPGMDQDDMFFTIPIVYNKVVRHASAEKDIAS